MLFIVFSFSCLFWNYWGIKRYIKELLKANLNEVVMTDEMQRRSVKRWFIKVSGYLIASIMFAGVYFLADNNNYLVALILLVAGVVLVIGSLMIKDGSEYLLNENILYEEGKNHVSFRLKNKQVSRLKKFYYRYKIALILSTLSLSLPCVFYLWVAYQLSIN